MYFLLYFLLLASFFNLSANTNQIHPTEQQAINHYNAFKNALKNVKKISNSYTKKYKGKAHIICTTCNNELSFDNFIYSFILGAYYDFYSDNQTPSTAKKLLDEIFTSFPVKSLDELLTFMKRAANELKIKCEYGECESNEWDLITSSETKEKQDK